MSGGALVLGRYREAVITLALDRSAEGAARLGDLLARRGDFRNAAIHFARARELEPRSPSIALGLADALASAQDRPHALEVLRSVAARARGAPRYLAPAARIALDAGLFDLAREIARDLLTLGSEPSAAHDVLGHLALFGGDTEEALTSAKVLRATGDARSGLTIQGGAELLLGRYDAALETLDEALRTGGATAGPTWEARTWRAEVLLRKGDVLASAVEADRAVSDAPGFFLAARVVGALARLQNHPDVGTSPARDAYDAAEWGEIGAAAVAVLGNVTEGPLTPRQANEIFERVLHELRGNRSLGVSVVRDGALTAVGIPKGVRWASRSLLNLVAVRPPSQLLEDFDALVVTHPSSALPRGYRGELLSWLGDYDRARSDLEQVVRDAPFTRWAYIGLATLENLAGRPERALATLDRGVTAMHDTTGPGVYGVRGEALLLQARAREAIAELERGCAIHPGRVGSWVILGIAYDETGEAGEVARVACQLEERAFPLWRDAAEDAGVSVDDPSARRATLEGARRLLLGNRSSSLVTWSVKGGTIRALSGATSRATVTVAERRAP